MSNQSWAIFEPGYTLENGEIKIIPRPSPVQISNKSELDSPAMQDLPPTSIAKLAGWEKAWQKDNDGEWQPMIGGE